MKKKSRSRLKNAKSNVRSGSGGRREVDGKRNRKPDAESEVSQGDMSEFDALAMDMRSASESIRSIVEELLRLSPSEARLALESATDVSRQALLGFCPELRMKIALGWHLIRRFETGKEKRLTVGFPSLGRLKRVLSALGETSLAIDVDRISAAVRSLEEADMSSSDESSRALWEKRKALSAALFSNYEEGDEADIPMSVIEEGVRDFFLGYSIRKLLSPKKLAELERCWESMSGEANLNTSE